jgi:3-oxoacyl-[acyl-carrier-protein] synthase III
VLSILGIGAAFPETILTNAVLRELLPVGEPFSEELLGGVLSRRSALPLSYLNETKNCDPEAGLKAALSSPTDLAVQAVEQALASAGIAKEQLGLILGDTATPSQSTPAEAQRVGERMQLKVDAYDVLGGGAALPLQLDVLSRWKSEKTPEYVLLLTSNTPSQRTDYRRLTEGRFVGDSAAAFVVSKQHAGKYSVTWSRYRSVPSQIDLFLFDRYQHCQLAQNAVAGYESLLSQELAEAKRHVRGSDFYCVLSGLCPESEQRVARFGGVAPDRLLSLTATHGHSLGSQVGSTLAHFGSTLKKGSSVVLVSVSAGSGVGSVVLHIEG